MLSKLRDALLDNSKEGNLDQVRELVNTGLDVNLGKGEYGYNACLLAAFFNKPEVVRLLLAAGIGVGC